jgi:hypothetical protein
VGDRPSGHAVRDVEEPVDELAVRVDARGLARGTNAPFAPVGTMIAFFIVCVRISPRTSVRKSSGRSERRSPPRATRPARRCRPSTIGARTYVSNIGRGSVRNGTSAARSFSTRRSMSPRA